MFYKSSTLVPKEAWNLFILNFFPQVIRSLRVPIPKAGSVVAMTGEILIVVILLSGIVGYAKNRDNDDDPCEFVGEWKIRGKVDKLYDTPLGEVFRIYPSIYCNMGHNYRRGFKDKKFNSIQFDVFKDVSNKNRARRFIVVDFKIRTFPAISKKANPNLAFVFTRSNKDFNEIEYYRDINGLTRYEDGLWIPNWRRPLLGNSEEYASCLDWSVIAGRIYHPNYHVVSCRIILDTFEGGVFSTNINGYKYIARHGEKLLRKYPSHSFGVCIQYPQFTTNKDKYYTRTILEISKPRIILTDKEEVLRKLKPLKYIEYPYDDFTEPTERYLSGVNPDAIYAHAMKLLKGENPVKGVDLLEKIADRRDHIFAMYRLGICYWRGIGVKKDAGKALSWLNKARKYGLAEADAMYALVKMKSNPFPYINKHTKNRIYIPLNEYKKDYVMHENWLLSFIFNNFDAAGAPSLYSDFGLKTRFWNAKNQYMHQYYKNKVDKLFLGLDDDPVTGLRKKDNKFYEVRVPPCRFSCHGTDGSSELEKLISEGFSPAAYYLGHLTLSGYLTKQEKRAPNVKKAKAIFDKGAVLGNLDCKVEVLRCQVLEGNLKKEDFTSARDIELADHPLYQILKHIVTAPETPGAKEFLEGNYEGARKIWRETPSAANDFLLGAEGIYQYIHVGFGTCYYRFYYESIADLKEAYRRLDAAADKGVVPAVYLCGMYYITGQRNNTTIFDSDRAGKGCYMLQKAEQNGVLKATYYLIKYQFEKGGHIPDKWLQRLKPLRDTGDKDAWLLSSDILARMDMNRNSEKIIKAYRQSAKLGSVRAWDRLAWIYYKSGRNNSDNMHQAFVCWSQFVALDLAARNSDPFDPYSEMNIPFITCFYDKDGNPYPRYGNKLASQRTTGRSSKHKIKSKTYKNISDEEIKYYARTY